MNSKDIGEKLNRTEIKEIEDLSLNAWPSHQMQLYDGWILRFSHMYTYRTNCVEQIGTSAIPVDEKIDYCEKIYRRWETPCVFKITPLLDPAFDAELEARGYEVRNITSVMCCDLTAAEGSTRNSCGDPTGGMTQPSR